MTPARDPKAGENGPEVNQGKYAEVQFFFVFLAPGKMPEMAASGPEAFPYKSRPRQHVLTRI